METLLSWVGVLAILALVSSGVSLVLHRRGGSPVDLAHRVHVLELDLNELFDRVDHWQRRDRVRRLRDAPADLMAAQAPSRGTPEFKQALRAKAAAERAH